MTASTDTILKSFSLTADWLSCLSWGDRLVMNPTQRHPMTIRTLIVDDQLIARESLRRLLKDETDLEIVGLPASGREAVAAINTLSPNLVFLDVQMPDLDGFGVLAQISQTRLPIIIFVTANNDFALRAFDVHALDYLVKPVSRDRLRVAVQRAREYLRGRQTGELSHRMAALLSDLKSAPAITERLPVKCDGRVVFLRLADLDWVGAADNYVELHAGPDTHMLRETMAALEKKLPADRFLRISRSVIVNVEQIKELHPMFHGEYTVILRGGARLTLTRGYRDKLRLLGLA